MLYKVGKTINETLIVETLDDWLFQEGYRVISEVPQTMANERQKELDFLDIIDMRGN